MNESAKALGPGRREATVEVHRPTPLPPVPSTPVVPVQPGTIPTVASVVLPDGRIVSGCTLEPAKPEPVTAKPPVSRTAVNIALGGVGFLAMCGGLLMLTEFIAALTASSTRLSSSPPSSSAAGSPWRSSARAAMAAGPP